MGENEACCLHSRHNTHCMLCTDAPKASSPGTCYAPVCVSFGYFQNTLGLKITPGCILGLAVHTVTWNGDLCISVKAALGYASSTPAHRCTNGHHPSCEPQPPLFISHELAAQYPGFITPLTGVLVAACLAFMSDAQPCPSVRTEFSSGL